MLSHNIDNKVFIIDEFLPARDFNVVAAFASNLTLPYSQRTAGWSSEIILDSKRVKMGRAFLENKPAPLAIFERAVRAVRKVPWPEGRNLALSVYEWQRGSYIPMHDDHKVHFAVTFYMNATWNPNWGGDLLVTTRPTDIDQGVWISPRKNRLVITMAGVRHRTTMLSPSADKRLTLQGFVYTGEAQRQKVHFSKLSDWLEKRYVAQAEAKALALTRESS